MKFLIVGLGNIGDEYAGTRHNIGFMMIDAFAASVNAHWEDKRYGFVAKCRVKSAETLVAPVSESGPFIVDEESAEPYRRLFGNKLIFSGDPDLETYNLF